MDDNVTDDDLQSLVAATVVIFFRVMDDNINDDDSQSSPFDWSCC
jgi:hypothetical protein